MGRDTSDYEKISALFYRSFFNTSKKSTIHIRHHLNRMKSLSGSLGFAFAKMDN